MNDRSHFSSHAHPEASPCQVGLLYDDNIRNPFSSVQPEEAIVICI